MPINERNEKSGFSQSVTLSNHKKNLEKSTPALLQHISTDVSNTRLLEENRKANQSLEQFDKNKMKGVEKYLKKISQYRKTDKNISGISNPLDLFAINHTLKQTIGNSNLQFINQKTQTFQKQYIHQQNSDEYKIQDGMSHNSLEISKNHILQDTVSKNGNTTVALENIPPSITTNNIKNNTKSKLRRLTAIFMFLLIGMIIGYKILTNGISIERINIAGVQIHNIFLQLDNRLILQIDKLDLTNIASIQDTATYDKSFTESLYNTVNYIQKSFYILSYFKIFEIKNMILYNNYRVAIKYNDTTYELDTPIFNAKFTIINNQNNLYLKIATFEFVDLSLHLEGDFIFSIPQKQLLFDIKAIKNNDDTQKAEFLTLKGMTNFQTIVLNGESSQLGNLDIIKPFIDNIQEQNLRKTLQAWIFEKVKYSQLKINEIKMNIEIDNIAHTLLKNTIVKATIQKPEVTLNKGVKPITGKEVLLEFKEASLNIIPIQAEFERMDLNNSEVLIANMPHPSVYITLSGKNIYLNSDLKKLIASYGLTLPIKQYYNTRNSQHTRTTIAKIHNNTALDTTATNIENIVTKIPKEQLLPSKTDTARSPLSDNTAMICYIKDISTDATESNETKNQQNQILDSDIPTQEKYNQSLYDKILELNPNTTLTNDLLHNIQETEQTSVYIKIAIEHNHKMPSHPLFSLQGIIHAKDTDVELYGLPLYAKKLNVALDIAPQHKFVYVNGSRIKWKEIINADVNVLLDFVKQNIQANTYIYQAQINTNNLDDLRFTQDKQNAKQKISIIPNLRLHNTLQHNTEHYAVSTQIPTNAGIYFDKHNLTHYNQTWQDSAMYKIIPIQYIAQNEKVITKNQQNNITKDFEISQEDLQKLQQKDSKDDERVLKTLKNNPVWDDLKIRTKKTRPFTRLSDKELQTIALHEIQKDSKFFSFKHDFLYIKNTNIDFNLSFANNSLMLNIPKLSLFLQLHKSFNLKITKIENILQFSPLAQYYGITHGNLQFSIPQITKQDTQNIEFVLNLTNLQYPLYTSLHEKVSSLNLKGKIHNDSIIIMANDNMDFKSHDSLSMLRIKDYRIDIDEAYNSKIPFFIDLFKDKQKDLPYSEAAIRQEIRLIAIKNKLRKQMKINPFDFNILGNNLQFTFLGYTIPFDSVTIRFIDGNILIDGQYEKGIANINVIKDNVSIKAKNFSGDFINTVFMSAKDGKKIVNNGTFSLDALYRGGIFNASMEIQNTAIIEFKAMQNIFALIDAVPSLFMFKNPHISTTGYQINFGKVLFAINNDYVGLQNIFLLGNSMDINGRGIIDIETQEINANLNISTIKNLSKFINKIPILGYLILGREGQISTNLILTGKYSNPKVNITIAEDIVKAPFNILRRVFPIEMIIENFKNGEETIDF